MIENTVKLRDFSLNPNNPSKATETEIERLAGKIKRNPVGLRAMRSDAAEIAAAGDADTAEWLRDWCDRADNIQLGEDVDAETLDNALCELRDNGYADDASAIDSIRKVWSDTRSSATIYRTDMGVYFMMSDGVPTFFDDVAEARAQIA